MLNRIKDYQEYTQAATLWIDNEPVKTVFVTLEYVTDDMNKIRPLGSRMTHINFGRDDFLTQRLTMEVENGVPSL